eukprot:145241-Amphidinium_carterae.1
MAKEDATQQGFPRIFTGAVKMASLFFLKERDKVMAERRRAAMEHEEQMRVAQEDISRLRTQLIQGHMQIDGGGDHDIMKCRERA